jgi:predicted RNase H-like HicB family nuclease
MLYPIAVEKGSETEAYGVTVPDIKGCSQQVILLRKP